MLEKMKSLRKSKKKGFTLIELIVVIAILAILGALAVPAYNGLKRDAAGQVGVANARTAYTAYKAVEAMDQVSITDDTAVTTAVRNMLGTDMTGTVSVAGGVVTWTGTVGNFTVTATYSSSGAGTPSVT